MAIKTKYTPGPWELSDSSVWGTSPLNARFRIADIRQHSPMNGIDSKANASLIAAAPELLEALRNLLAKADQYIPYRKDGWNGDDRENWEIIDAARIAITKAEGK